MSTLSPISSANQHVYVVLLRNNTPLCEHSNARGNFIALSKKILNDLKLDPKQNTTQTIRYDQEHFFTILVHDRLTFMCLTKGQTNDASRQNAIHFLTNVNQKIREKFQYKRLLKAKAYSLSELAESQVLLKQMSRANSNAVNLIEGNQLAKLETKLEAVKDVMSLNLTKSMENWEKIEMVVEKTETLSVQAEVFHRKSITVKKKLRWVNVDLS
tara:strand:- start:593 stop:1234 length:642 start_codon:yes stop_codon:yes gene_type:complete